MLPKVKSHMVWNDYNTSCNTVRASHDYKLKSNEEATLTHIPRDPDGSKVADDNFWVFYWPNTPEFQRDCYWILI